MPRYDYECTGCKAECELMHSIADCDLKQTCEGCGAPLERLIPRGQVLDMAGGFQTHAILSDGARVAGHFGTEARLKGSPPYKP